jgi:putative YphP/YqiW family bacilliredoxin
MAYSELLLTPMRQDLTRYGVAEARTPEMVDQMLSPGSGTVLMIVNSVCGCAAGKARPAVGMALSHSTKPDHTATVFAGGDVEATEYLREKYLGEYPPSSPSMAIFRDGKPVYYMHRRQIESRDAASIAAELRTAFEQHCGVKVEAVKS